MKKLLALFLVVVMLFSMTWAGSVDAFELINEFEDGDGSAGNPC